MMRALWTAGSGMMAQQLNVDVISNNLSNVNTTAFKKQRIEFKDLLYETLSKSNINDGVGKPVSLQVGHGVAPAATVSTYTVGNLEKTDNPLDFALDGEGFFAVKSSDGIKYTKDGSFKVSNNAGELKLVTSEGYPVLDEQDNEIILTDVPDISKLQVNIKGALSYSLGENADQPLGQSIKIIRFSNKEGVLKVGSNSVIPSSASGEPIPELGDDKKTQIMQGYLESSNVQVVEEMVKLIIAQRAYEINPKSVQTADEMLSMANNLRK